MISWRLWKALRRRSLEHPLFERAVADHRRLKKQRRSAVTGCGVAILAIGGFVAVIFLGTFVPVVLNLFVVSYILLPLLLVNLLGIGTAVNISRVVAEQHESGMYDLISLSPSGPFGVCWAACKATLHHNSTYRDLRLLSTVLFFIGLGLSFLGVDFGAPLFVIALFIDYNQIISLGVVVGMFTPLYAHNRVNASIWATTAYLTVQLITYVAALLVGVIVLPAIFNININFETELVAISTAVSLLAFSVLREITMGVMWRRLTQQLNISPAEEILMFER